jgi:molybdate transport system substrate-binding protein
MIFRLLIVLTGIVFGAATPVAACAGEITVAAAANFVGTLQKLITIFEASGDRKVTVISGSTGKLATQVASGAPFDIFLSADEKATKKLVESGGALADSEFTYAIGTLALFSADPSLITGSGADILKAGQFDKLAIANPKTAPYGVAALSTMRALGVADDLKGKIVMGENISQTFQMIDTGNAQLGFVALSQVRESASGKRGSHWIVPADLHPPIRQNAVLLTRAENSRDAREFLAFLKGPEAREVIGAAGYSLDD